MIYDKLKEYRNDMLKNLLIFAGFTEVLASMVNFFNHRPLNNILISLICSVLLAALYFQKKIWYYNNFARIFILVIICFIYLPIDWYTSSGVTGAMPNYSLLIIVMITFFLEKFWEIIFPIGIIFEVLIFFDLEFHNPDFFYGYVSQKQQFISLSYNFVIVAIVLLFVIYSINRRVELDREELYKLSITDELTKVYNRRFLIDSLETIINQSQRHNAEFIILFIDINKFKIINDTLGHQIGDSVLIELGRVVHVYLRNYDICGRYGGDEFMIILPYTELEESKVIAERISSQFAHSIKEKLKIEGTITIGFSRGKGRTLHDIIKEADKQMYDNKL